MSMHALRLTGKRTEPRWLHGGRTTAQADTPAPRSPDEPDLWVQRAMDASLHLHAALPHIADADADAAEHARAAVAALDAMIKALHARSLPDVD